MSGITHWIWLAAAGAVGVLCRAAVTAGMARLCGEAFPWGLTAVNLAGSLAFGLIVAATPLPGGLPEGFEKILLVGLLGGFTTFSSFAFDAVRLFEVGRPAAALALVAANNLGGFAAAWVGLRLGGG